MIVRQFLFWLRSAPAGERAEATAALARAYLYSDLSNDDLAAAEGAMTMLLDDPSPLVRAAMAEVLAASEYAPTSVIYALAADQPEIAAVIFERSPLLIDAELVDAVATHGALAQIAIARRARLPRSVAAAMAEVGTAEACLELLENPGADIAPFSIDRIVNRFGHLAPIREELLAREDLPASIRQALVAKLSKMLAEFVVSREWLHQERAHRVAREACEKVTVALAASTAKGEVRPLIRHLRESGQLTAGLILRALLSGNMTMVEEALADLSGLSLSRVSALIHGRGGSGLRAVYQKAGLPGSAYPAFREAIATLQHDGFLGDPSGSARLKRRMIERVLTRCAGLASEDIQPLLMLLRRFATEAAREEARMFCEDLVDGMMSEQAAWQQSPQWHEQAGWQDNAASYRDADEYADDRSAGCANTEYDVARYSAQYATEPHSTDDIRYDETGYEASGAGYADETAAGDNDYRADDGLSGWMNAGYGGADNDRAAYEYDADSHAADTYAADDHAAYGGAALDSGTSDSGTFESGTFDSGTWDEVFPEFDGAREVQGGYSNTNDHITFDDVWDGTPYPAAENENPDYSNSRYAA